MWGNDTVFVRLALEFGVGGDRGVERFRIDNFRRGVRVLVQFSSVRGLMGCISFVFVVLP